MACRYFVTKCASFSSLQNANQTNIWACSDRQHDPQPRHVLNSAMSDGPVVLIFSVNNCHGWHGYATMMDSPGSAKKSMNEHSDNEMGVEENIRPTVGTVVKTQVDKYANIVTREKIAQLRSCHGNTDTQNEPIHIDNVGDNVSTQYTTEHDCQTVNAVSERSQTWHCFPIKWHRLFLCDHGEQCVSFPQTLHLTTTDGTPVNKARNMEEICCADGKALCDLIDAHYRKLDEVKQQKHDKKTAKKPAAFFQPSSTDVNVIWKELLEKVETLGKVLIACPFGSQR